MSEAPHILFDTNILVDAGVEQRKHHVLSLKLMGLVEASVLYGYVAPASITTYIYLVEQTYRISSRPLLHRIEKDFRIASMKRSALQRALEAPPSADLEDAYIAAAGAEAGADIVVTRNERDFIDTALRPYHPDRLLRVLDL